jgi:metallo-beta-lactamase class B
MDEWDKPGLPFRVYGSTYYVGTCGISSILVAGPDGHTLIDSGTDKGADIVLANIRALGFLPQDVKTLLMTHEHFDHIGGMAKLQAATGATIIATAPAAGVLRSGKPGAADPQVNAGHPPFPPVTGAIQVLRKPSPQRLAGKEFRPIFTPGHTPGAVSWRWRDCEGSDCKTIVYADSLNPISGEGYRFSDHPKLVAAFRKGLKVLAAADCDIVLAPHPTAALLRDRLLGNRAVVDRSGCRNYATTASAKLDARLAQEATTGKVGG